MQLQVKLSSPKEPLQISYPSDYTGQKSGGEDDAEFHLTTQPKMLSTKEVELAEDYVKSLPYPQNLEKTGCVLGLHPDLEKFQSLAEIDIYEQQNNLPSTAVDSSGGSRLLRERLVIATENLVLGQ